MEAKDLSFEEIKVGESVNIERNIPADDVLRFAELSGDYNPLHTDKKYAEGTLFKEQVVHGMFLASLVSQLIGMKLPGKRSLILREALEFKKPAFIGDTVNILGKVLFKSEATKIIEIGIEIHNQHDELLSSGSVQVKTL